ncbi:MAG: hypothetical protein JXR03_02420 [Cyclobacteriaceae bacterium]
MFRSISLSLFLIAFSYATLHAQCDFTAVYPSSVTKCDTLDHAIRVNTKVDGLVAYYPFHGDAFDYSGNNNHGEVKNLSLDLGRLNQSDEAYRFSGSENGYISIPHSQTLSLNREMTLSAWFFYEEQVSSSFFTIIEKTNPEAGGHSRYGMWVYNGGTVEICIEPDNCAPNLCQRCLDAEDKLELDTWTHITGVYDGNTLKIYFNGVLNAESTPINAGISQTQFEVFIGTDIYGGAQFLTGKLDEVKIFNRALTDSEVQENFNLQYQTHWSYIDSDMAPVSQGLKIIPEVSGTYVAVVSNGQCENQIATDFTLKTCEKEDEEPVPVVLGAEDLSDIEIPTLLQISHVLEFPKSLGVEEARIYSLDGKLQLRTNQASLDFSKAHFKEGVYILSLATTGGLIRKRVKLVR